MTTSKSMGKGQIERSAKSPDRAVILSGGNLGEWALPYINQDDLVIAADRGALFAVQHAVRPHMSLGDFDSVSPEEIARIQAGSGQVNACDPVWKDLTDTEMAFEYAIACGVKSIVLLGATGTRLDHTMANIHLLAKADRQHIDARVIDANNEIQLVSGRTERTAIRRGDYTYLSLLPLTDEVTGITLSGFRYPLVDAVLTLGESRGISNEFAPDVDVGTIDIKSGKLLVIQSRD